MSRGSLALCPYCKGPARVRNSIPVTVTHRDMYFYCQDESCGHTWKAQLSFVYSISTPSLPANELTLPTQPERYRRRSRDGEPPPVAVPA